MLSGYSLALFSSFLQSSAMMLLLPVFSDRRLLGRTRVVIIVFLSGLISFSRVEDLDSRLCASASAGVIFLNSFILGVVLGMVFRVPVIIIEMSGSLISQIGSFSQIFGPAVSEDISQIFGSVLSYLVIIFLVSMGFHTFILDALLTSSLQCNYQESYLGSAFATLKHIGQGFFNLFFSISFPFILLGSLYFVCIGLIGRAMPQFMATFIGTPALQFMTIVLLYFAFEYLVQIVTSFILDGGILL